MFRNRECGQSFLFCSASRLGKGLDEQLARFVAERTDTKLIIIDTLQKVREVGGDNYSYANDYQIYGKAKKLCRRPRSLSPARTPHKETDSGG